MCIFRTARAVLKRVDSGGEQVGGGGLRGVALSGRRRSSDPVCAERRRPNENPTGEGRVSVTSMSIRDSFSAFGRHAASQNQSNADPGRDPGGNTSPHS